ncbi:putative quinol monooxygenase [Streptomyces sp. NPDC001796]|uniref:putative quinol monooxygenase n=1 Tax=Streptomyces sp. NPDC001796 TaxID=3364609 RepID=UPI00367F0A28
MPHPETGPIVLVARMQARPGKEQELRDALPALVAATRQEDGCLTYVPHQGLDDPGLLVMHEVWQSEEHLRAHSGSDHLRQFAKLAETLTVGGIQIERLTELAVWTVRPAGNGRRKRLRPAVGARRRRRCPNLLRARPVPWFADDRLPAAAVEEGPAIEMGRDLSSMSGILAGTAYRLPPAPTARPHFRCRAKIVPRRSSRHLGLRG